MDQRTSNQRILHINLFNKSKRAFKNLLHNWICSILQFERRLSDKSTMYY